MWYMSGDDCSPGQDIQIY